MFIGKADLGLICFCEEVDDELEDPDSFLTEKISKGLFVTVYKAQFGDSSLFF
jgi:hypothetical protein